MSNVPQIDYFRQLDFFNNYGQADVPVLILCNPNRQELFPISKAYNVEIKLRFNALCEITFKVPEKENDTYTYGYNTVTSKRLIFIYNMGYFIIDEVNEDNDGIKNIKSVKASSLEAIFMYKRLTAFNGTYRFYNPLLPTSLDTIVGKVLNIINPGYAPATDWKFGHIDSELFTTYRTFSINDTNLYNFLMNDCEKSYGCVFLYDSIHKLINVYMQANVLKSTNIYLSYENVLKNTNFSEKSDEIATVLYVYGANPMSVANVNPTGGVAMYDFSYYMKPEWMSTELINRLTKWNTKINNNQVQYASLLTQYRQQNIIIQDLINKSDAPPNDGLAYWKNKLVADTDILKVDIEAKADATKIASDNAAIKDDRVQIKAWNNYIAQANNVLAGIDASIKAIVVSLAFKNNFTMTQLAELSNYIIENTYQNENFVQVDSDTPQNIQDTAQSLYNQAKTILSKISQPRYEFKAEAINILFLPEFREFIKQIDLGATMTISDDNSGKYIEAVLLEIDISFDSPTSFSMIFGNRLRLNNNAYAYSDLFGKGVSAGTNNSFSKSNWDNWTGNYKDTVSTFITSALNTANNELINSDNQEITITKSGLQGKTYIKSTGDYDPKQVWLTSNILAFTEDGWDSVKLAIGEVTLPDGITTGYGVVGDVLVGRILAGNNLVIANDKGSFTVDGDKATLTDMILTLTSSSGNQQIKMNPTDGIVIKSLVNNALVRTFYVDSSGNLTFKGTLTGANGDFTGKITANEGHIGGWKITNNGISQDATSPSYYIYSDGTAKIGAMTVTKSGTTYKSVFLGDVQADNLFGRLNVNNLVGDFGIIGTKIGQYIRADNVNRFGDTGMSGNMVYNGAISGSGGFKLSLSETATGVHEMRFDGVLQISANGSPYGVDIQSNSVTLSSPVVNIGTPGNSIIIRGSLTTNGENGLDQTISYLDSSSVGHTMTFRNGLLVGAA